jgi:flavin reductase (DIM6/NTAB) family NADH-FMN oxidoreductase RutF
MGMGIDHATFRAAMARFPGAVTIITARQGTERRGITATAVCSVSAEPPSLLVCVNRKTGTCAAIREIRHLQCQSVA